jgi:hypothetical protein
VRVDLGGRQAGVAQHLLYGPEIGAPLKEVSGRTVSQTVRPQVRDVGHALQQVVNRAANLARIDPATSATQE